MLNPALFRGWRIPRFSNIYGRATTNFFSISASSYALCQKGDFLNARIKHCSVKRSLFLRKNHSSGFQSSFSVAREPLCKWPGYSRGALFSNATLGVSFSFLFPVVYCDDERKDPVKPVISEDQALDFISVSPVIQPRPSLLADIWILLKQDMFLLLATMGTALAAAAVSLMIPVYIGEFVHQLTIVFSARQSMPIKLSPSSMLWELLSIFRTDDNQLISYRAIYSPIFSLLALFSLQGALTSAYISLITVVGENLASRLKRQLFASLVTQDMAFYDRHKSGDLMNRLNADVQDFKHAFKMCLSQGLKNATQAAGGAFSLYLISPPLTLLLFSSLPVIYGIGSVYGSFLRKLSRASRDVDSAASAIANETLMNIRTVRAFASEQNVIRAYEDELDHVRSLHTRLGHHIGLFQGLTNFSSGGVVFLVLTVGSQLVASNALSTGQLMSYLIATQSVQRSITNVMVLFGQLVNAMSAGTRVVELLHQYPTIPLSGGLVLPNFKGHIAFQGVDFSYPTRPRFPVLQSFDLTIPAGHMIAICGPSGSGKSTLAWLLERFYDPQGGAILIDGIPLHQLDPRWLRQQIGLINQEPSLFATTIFENIRYGRWDATDEQVIEAARLANASSFIEKFPDGYQTLLGERGVTLSGGQKQRIAIARAILKDPKILILDEATSALDVHSERLVQEALDLVMKNRTVIVIAHRLSTIRGADTIVVLDPVTKRVVECGTHDELIRMRGAYYVLCQKNQIVDV